MWHLDGEFTFSARFLARTEFVKQVWEGPEPPAGLATMGSSTVSDRLQDVLHAVLRSDIIVDTTLEVRHRKLVWRNALLGERLLVRALIDQPARARVVPRRGRTDHIDTVVGNTDNVGIIDNIVPPDRDRAFIWSIRLAAATDIAALELGASQREGAFGVLPPQAHRRSAAPAPAAHVFALFDGVRHVETAR